MKDSKRFGLEDRVIQKIQSVFKSHESVEKVIIYGSRSRGTFKTGSDIDLTLVGSKLDTTLLLKIENELDELLLPYKIDLSIKAQIDNPDVLAHIDVHGQVFYQKGF